MYTPYTLQPLLPSVSSLIATADDYASSSPASPSSPRSSSSSFFSRRQQSPNPANSDKQPLVGSPSRFNSLLSQSASVHSSSPPSSSTSTSPPPQSAFTIDAVAAWDNNLYLGTSDGHILHFTLEEQTKARDGEIPYTSRLESKINLGFGRKSVERILVIPQVSKAIALCDATMSFYSLPFFDPIPVSLIPHIKGVSAFTHNVAQEGRIGEDGTVEICVGKRRVIQFYKIGELVQLWKEVPLHEGVITMIQMGHHVCLADHENHKLIDLTAFTSTVLVPTPHVVTSPTTTAGSLVSMTAGAHRVARPVLAVVKEGEFLMVSGTVSNSAQNQTTIGIIVNAYGEPVHGTMQWSSYPKAICVEYPYIAALLRNQTIEIHNVLDQQLLQVIQLNSSIQARGMAFAQGIKVWMEGLARRLRRRPWKAAEQDVNEEEEANYRRQVARYATMPARVLVYGRDAVLAQLVTPLVVQVDGLLDNHEIEIALETADQARNTMSADNNIHVARMQAELDYIYQKAGFLLLQETVFEDALTLLSKGNLDPRVVIAMFGQQAWLSDPAVYLFDGVRGLVDSLGAIENIVGQDPGRQQKNGTDSELRRTLMANARDALEKYLHIERGKFRHLIGQDHAISKAIDSALLHIYILNDNDTAILELLQRPNDCSLQGAIDALQGSKRYYAASILYHTKHMYDKVLELWTKIYTGEYADPRMTDGLGQIKRLLLQDIPNDELSLEATMRYAWWLLGRKAEDSIEVFIRSPRAPEMDMDAILSRLDKEASPSALRTYLEYVVWTRQSQSAEHHTRLAILYLNDVEQVAREHTEECGRLADEYKLSGRSRTFVEFLGDRRQSSEIIRRRLLLIRLLQRSPLYDAQTIMDRVQQDDALFNVERVIVYGRMKEHSKALAILIHNLCDFAGAETYCVTNGESAGTLPDMPTTSAQSMPPARTSSLKKRKEKPLPEMPTEAKQPTPEQMKERRELFAMLLRTYLDLQDSDVMLSRTMHLLATQGYYLDILEVLQWLPDDWPIATLQHFLIRSLRRSLHAYRNGQVVLGISRGENLMVGSELVNLYKEIGPTTVDIYSTCHQCHRPLAESIVVRLPNGNLSHIKCSED